jgi:hypothetical protein
VSALDYSAFLERKTHLDTQDGFKPLFMPIEAFDFQEAMIDFAVRGGRRALFSDCGTGKSLMELAWGENVVRHTNRPVLLLTPLAVASQMVREAEKFGIEARRFTGGAPKTGINVVNYERLHQVDLSDVAGVICDESSILKNFDGSRRKEITEVMRKLRYRLLCTATAAPNDYIELGTSSEALGYLGHIDMLNRFFKNDMNNSARGRAYGEVIRWRFKGHAEEPFWRWVCSWARAMRKPSDLGFDDLALTLPPLLEEEHVVGPLEDDAPIAVGLKEQREERKASLVARCEKAAEVLNAMKRPGIAWCQLNPEGDLLEKLIRGAVQVSGSDSDEEKEEKFQAFLTGEARVLVTKTKIGAWGLNFQHCGDLTVFPDHSFEQYYQAIRRCWRFGRQGPVNVHMVTTPRARGVLSNLKRKSEAADRMFSRLVAHMRNELQITREDRFTTKVEVPSWV